MITTYLYKDITILGYIMKYSNNTGSNGKAFLTDNMEKILLNFLLDREDVDLSEGIEISKDLRLIVITGRDGVEDTIPVFLTPLIIKDTHDVLFVDMRSNVVKNELKLDTMSEVEIVRLKLMGILHDDETAFEAIKTEIVRIFAVWVSDTLGSLYVLSEDDKMAIKVAAGYWYYGMTLTKSEFKQDRAIEFTKRLSKLKKSEAIETRLMMLPNPSGSQNQLMEMISTVCDNKEIDKLTGAALVLMLSKTIFTRNTSANTIDMLTHVPTFLSIIYNMTEHNLYKKTKLSKLLMDYKDTLQTQVVMKRITVKLRDI